MRSGDVLFGSITYNPGNESYTIYHKVGIAIKHACIDAHPFCIMRLLVQFCLFETVSFDPLQDMTDGWSVSTNIKVEKATGGGYKVCAVNTDTDSQIITLMRCTTNTSWL